MGILILFQSYGHPLLSIKLHLEWCREVNLTSDYLNNIKKTFYNYKNPLKAGLLMILAIFVFPLVPH